MNVHFVCGYYSDIAHRNFKPRPDIYWDARKFVLSVKIGTYKHPFTIHTRKGKIPINQTNFKKVRKLFGVFINDVLISESIPDDALLVPVPSKDGINSSNTYRSLRMLQEAMSDTDTCKRILNAVQWTTELPKSHESGPQERAYWRSHMTVTGDVRSKNIVLIDDVITTGSTLLAAKEVLEHAGASVLGAVCCGKTIYDLETKAFGKQSLILESELHDYCG